jgi:hypothetical protein
MIHLCIVFRLSDNKGLLVLRSNEKLNKILALMSRSYFIVPKILI